MVSLAQVHDRLATAGARLVGISVDDTGRNAAMVDKLHLPFPLLSDPGGAAAIKPYDVWHAEPEIAHPAIVVVTPDREVAFRYVGGDFADRPTEDDVVAAVERLDLPPTTQPPPTPGSPEPGPRAIDVGMLPAYLLGAKYAATAMKMRVPDAAESAETLVAEYDRYRAAVGWLRKRHPGSE